MYVTFSTTSSWLFRRAASLRLRLRGEGGFTLVEMLVAATLSTIVVGATMSALEVAQRTQARDTEWGLVLQEGRAGLGRMIREIRQAYSIRSATENSLDFYATFGGVDYEIYYACNVAQTGTEFNRCVRLQAEVGKSLPALSTGQTIVRYVVNGTSADPSDPIFKEYSPNAIVPDLVTVKLVLPASGTLKLAGAKTLTHQVVLTNNAYIRDMNLGK
ncbi:MAG TPA: prepilin-type N-terminal cleavage/methylation domain-containing protein [Solirubrobacteraceae bacterium]|jgi:type II secretory pathway pseudopilin PulG|nr:prepilin-type N-terminal cleavage/methylation domain-containing protein [Solirubrobacteraceae bacterium]